MQKTRLKILLTKELHGSWGIVMLAVGIIAGVVLGLALRINYFGSVWWLVLVAIIFFIMFVNPKLISVGSMLIAGMILAFFRVATDLSGGNYIQNLTGEAIIVTGAVSGDPVTDESSTTLKLTNLSFGPDCDIWASTEPEPTFNPPPSSICHSGSGQLYVSLSRHEEISRGDRLILQGELLGGFGTYAGYLYRPKIIKLARPTPGDWVLNIRNWFAERIRRLIGAPEVDLGLSYLLGMKTGLPDDLSSNLRTVGLVHIVVASGAHLSILVEIAKKLFGKISRMTGLLAASLFIFFFMSMVGWTPSILRAGIMAFLTLLAGFTGRKIAPWRIILLVAAGTLLISPMFVIDLGWLLSFASFTGIMILGPKFTHFFYGSRPPGFIGSTILTTVAATIMTLPIVIYYYGQISLISVVANLLILPTLPYAMGLTFLTGAIADIPIVNIIISWLATKLLDFHIATVNFFSNLSQFLFTTDPYNPWVFALYAIVIIGLLIEKVVKLKQVNNIGAKLCQDTANGPPPSVKKPS
ncbi:ComEC/Rec2 family competence protein [Candidatus Saccharibacteria bacterium]|nr:ComEC/Rec2 family competence protein [Candidatus Saccharibacteria bacterium]